MSQDRSLSSGVRHLSRVGDSTPAPDHSVFWGWWFRTLVGDRPRLEAASGDDAPGVTHTFKSVGGAVVGCRLLEAEGQTRAGVVVLHGYSSPRPLERDAVRWRWATQRGLAVLLVRVRGYPGSARTTGDMTTRDERGLGWITRGFDAPGEGPESMTAWVLPQAVADVANACRVMRNRLAEVEDGAPGRPLTEKRPLFLVGESLGGALAVMAAAQLSGRLAREQVIDRLVIGSPALGDWAWRLEHEAAGTGREIASVLELNPARREELLTRLRLTDTVVHAGRVRTPTLCKLALHDEVVPAPTAAAVFNALATSPGQKWRFVVPVGHASGDLACTRRHVLFERCLQDFLDPTREADEAMIAWEDVMLQGDRPPEAGAPGDQGALFEMGSTDEVDRALVAVYQRAGRTLDALPYTDAFESLHRELVEALGERAPDRREAFHRLHNLRKAGRLPRMGRTETSVPKISGEDQEHLTRLVVDAAGSLGARDRLVYAPEFDALVERFNAEAGHTLSNHDAWRLIARLAK
ncbi:MAG: acetylxylan esterase [Phycisphaerales bacterium]